MSDNTPAGDEIAGVRIDGLTNELHGAGRLVDTAAGDDAGAAWWSQTGSNRRPPACKAGALPTELWPRSEDGCRRTEVGAPFASDICRLTSVVRIGGPGKI